MRPPSLFSAFHRGRVRGAGLKIQDKSEAPLAAHGWLDHVAKGHMLAAGTDIFVPDGGLACWINGLLDLV